MSEIVSILFTPVFWLVFFDILIQLFDILTWYINLVNLIPTEIINIKLHIVTDIK